MARSEPVDLMANLRASIERAKAARTVADPTPHDKIPRSSVGLTALTDDDPSEPTSAVQYSVLQSNGYRQINGDQQWVADGRALDFFDGHVERRTITVTYGEWEPA